MNTSHLLSPRSKQTNKITGNQRFNVVQIQQDQPPDRYLSPRNDNNPKQRLKEKFRQEFKKK